MKYLVILTAIMLLTSFCGHNAGSSAGDAVFSYNLQGQKITGGKTDELQLNNAVYLTNGDQGKKFVFFLNDAYRENTETFGHSLRFTIPAKTGTTKLAADQDYWNVELFLATGSDGKYDLYANEAFTINVDNISSTRISGTFSGKVKQVTGGQAELAITDGKFDVPIRTSAK